eukprot:TRINITY_DN74644_c0_g1_i1.p1 TRINITY_DN74644_c0_g1~~TRINITY_DN74644_c0_g1_i1.p1  ORF type:complete len:188 (-),score=31.74 TRINITY_DN74644_c0_g1_i1:12-575(-)
MLPFSLVSDPVDPGQVWQFWPPKANSLKSVSVYSVPTCSPPLSRQTSWSSSATDLGQGYFADTPTSFQSVDEHREQLVIPKVPFKEKCFVQRLHHSSEDILEQSVQSEITQPSHPDQQSLKVPFAQKLWAASLVGSELSPKGSCPDSFAASQENAMKRASDCLGSGFVQQRAAVRFHDELGLDLLCQ